MTTPDRGDVFLVPFPFTDLTDTKRRPALVLSPAAYNHRATLALVCPITTRRKGYPFEVPLPAGHAVSGVVLADHLKSIDWAARRAALAGRVGAETLEEVLGKLRTLLGAPA